MWRTPSSQQFFCFQQKPCISIDVILDNITFVEVPCVQNCEPTLTIMGAVSDLLYEAGNHIISTGNLMPNADVHFHAGDRISLENDFSVPSSAKFSAAIEVCGTAVQ